MLKEFSVFFDSQCTVSQHAVWVWLSLSLLTFAELSYKLNLHVFGGTCLPTIHCLVAMTTAKHRQWCILVLEFN